MIFCNFHDKQDSQCFRHYPESHTWLKSCVQVKTLVQGIVTKRLAGMHMPAEQHQYSPCIAVKRYEKRGRDPIVKQALHDAVYHCALFTTVLCLPLCSVYHCALLTTVLCLPLHSASRYVPSRIHWRGYVITRIVSMWLLRVVSGNVSKLHHLTVSAYFSSLQFEQQQCRALDHLR